MNETQHQSFKLSRNLLLGPGISLRLALTDQTQALTGQAEFRRLAQAGAIKVNGRKASLSTQLTWRNLTREQAVCISIGNRRSITLWFLAT